MRTIYVLILTISRLWLRRIPMILCMKNFTNFGSDGIWYAMLISNLIINIIGLLFYYYSHWEKGVINNKY